MRRALLVAAFAAWLLVVASLSYAQTSAVVVNECSTGSSGWIELVNRSSTAIDLARDAAKCWLVDDITAGGSPKIITDANVNHASASTACTSAGRPATCGIVAPGERVWIGFAYFNSTTADECRLVTATKSGSTCGTTYTDLAVGGAISSTAVGQCFGRQPESAGWLGASIVCTKGTANGGCSVGGVCEDANPCTTGESFSAACNCSGGAPLTGTSCGSGKICQDGICTSSSSSGAPVITAQGATDRILLNGTVVTPDTVFEGQVLIVGDTIACASASCQAETGAAGATIVQTNGILYPGLVDTHNHILFNAFDESDWSPSKIYGNHNQWSSDPRYQAVVDAKQYLNGEKYGKSGEKSPVSIGCELNKYGELKALIAGTTSVVGAANQADKICYGSLARTIDQRPNGLASDKVQALTLFPSTSTADAVCKNLAPGSSGAAKTDAFLIHIAEGTDSKALEEFGDLFSVTSTHGCFFSPKTAIVHGTALGDSELTTMAGAGMKLVWSPKSNVFLYGGGTDLSKTTSIPAAIERNITIALAPDWALGGSQNLLDEIRFADRVDNTKWGNTITPKMLTQMVTVNAAKILGLENTLGSIAVGRKADIMVIGGDRTKPYDALLAATPKDVRLVLVGGVALYGDSGLKPLGPASPGCEDLLLCGGSKFVCVAKAGGTAANKFGQTFETIKTVISTELQKFDDKNLTQWNFSPPAPLWNCQP